MCRLTALIFILFFVPNNAFDFHESSFWDNEYPKRFFDVPTIEEQTNYAFHNVQHDNSVPFRQLFQKNRQIDSVIIPFDDDPQGKPGIKEQINILIPNKTDQEKVLEIVDSKDKSLMEKIGDLTKTLANTSKSSGLEQSELLHELVSDERARENVLYELKDSLNSEYKTIADKLVGVQKNATLSENEKLEIQEKVLKNIAEKAKEAFKSFEAFFQRKSLEKHCGKSQGSVQKFRSIFPKITT
uniref:DUF148 domain-containing protein n=1 Tax=Panagrolaimus sp. JU765 TaxID=591449 RepID=A0AC34PYM4_9BILA